jgi:hypothetical protein
MEDQQPVVEFTTREEIAEMQASRLPALATRMSLHPRPDQVLASAVMEDALELAAADVLESGREFAQVNDDERRAILRKYLNYCRQRNLAFMYARETMN